MPAAMHAALKKAAADKGFEGSRADAYVYGAMNRMHSGMMKGGKKKKKAKKKAKGKSSDGYY